MLINIIIYLSDAAIPWSKKIISSMQRLGWGFINTVKFLGAARPKYSAIGIRESAFMCGTRFPLFWNAVSTGEAGGLQGCCSVLACCASRFPYQESVWTPGLGALRSARILRHQGCMPFFFGLLNPPSLSRLVPAKSKANHFKPWDVQSIQNVSLRAPDIFVSRK